MEQQARISVIVPIYKVEAFLPKCVESILGQTYPNLEVILVDDGSPDGCGALCDAYAQSDSRVRVIHKENGGLSDARNAGIEAATGDYLAFVDSDDWLEPDAYEAMLAAMQRHRARLVCAGRYDEDETTGARVVGLCPEREEAVSGVEAARRVFHWNRMDSSACDKLYARSLFDGIRYPVGRVCEDMPVTYRLMLRAESVVLLPKPVYHYRHRASSITMSQTSEKSFHYYQNSVMIYEAVKANVPELEPDAHYLLVCALRYNVQMLDLAGKEAKRRFRAEYRDSCRQLRQHFGFVRHGGHFTKRDQFEIAMTARGLFLPMMDVYHIFKKPKASV